ncbi:response regulator transcription factor [Sphingomonas arantia]|uniref:Response regulator transcription factor n=1 Tax=Sphingomonas arantia TaxID=1460676 RepID=A0ABW4TZF8_9SPHN
MSIASPAVAIVEDDAAVRTAVGNMVRSLGLRACPYDSAEAYLAVLPGDIDCIISDVNMPGMSGLDFQEALRAQGVTTPFIVMTGFATDAMAARANANGAWCFLEKPCDPEAIVGCLRRVFHDLPD